MVRVHSRSLEKGPEVCQKTVRAFVFFVHKLVQNIIKMAITRPKKGEFAPFHENYLNAVPKGNIQVLLRKTMKETQAAFAKFPPETHDRAYAEGKWTLKQKLAHMIDTERVFGFRALWFAKKDRQPQPGFNQDDWMEQTDVTDRTLADLLKEFKAARENTIYIVKNITDEQSKFIGTASNWQVSARTMVFCIVGHNIHHLNLLRDRYSVLLP